MGPLIKKRKDWTIQFLLNLKQIHTLVSGIFKYATGASQLEAHDVL